MKSLLLLSLSLFICFTSGAQSSQKYITETGEIYNEVQFDSIKNQGLPVGIVRDTIIKNQTYKLIKIYESIAVLQKFKANYEGEPLPNISLTLMDGSTVNTDDLKGKIIMLNFWSTTCGPCIKELPELNKLYKDYQQQVIFLAPLPESKAVTETFLQKYDFDFGIAPSSKEVFKKLEIDGYPKNAFVDRHGIIRQIREGTPSRKNPSNGEWVLDVYDSYSKILDSLIKEK